MTGANAQCLLCPDRNAPFVITSDRTANETRQFLRGRVRCLRRARAAELPRNVMQLVLSVDQREIDAGAMECRGTQRSETVESAPLAVESLWMSVRSEARSSLGPQSLAPRCRCESGSTKIPVCAGFVIPKGRELQALSGKYIQRAASVICRSHRGRSSQRPASPTLPRSEATSTDSLLSFTPSACARGCWFRVERTFQPGAHSKLVEIGTLHHCK